MQVKTHIFNNTICFCHLLCAKFHVSSQLKISLHFKLLPIVAQFCAPCLHINGGRGYTSRIAGYKECSLYCRYVLVGVEKVNLGSTWFMSRCSIYFVLIEIILLWKWLSTLKGYVFIATCVFGLQNFFCFNTDLS